MKVSTRLTFSFGALALIGIAMAVIGALRMRTLAAGLDDVANHRMVKMSQFTELSDNFNAIARAMGNIVLSEDFELVDAEKLKITNLRSVNVKLLKQLEADVRLPKEIEYLKTILDNQGDYNNALDHVLSLSANGEKAEPSRLLTGDVRKLQNVVFDAVDKSRTLQKEIVDQLAHESTEMARTAMTTMLGMALLMLLVGAGVARMITRNLSRALGAEPAELCQFVSQIADGDLDIGLPLRSDDTSSVLAAVKRMQTALTKVVSSVRQDAESVATASAQIASGNHDLSARTEQQAGALEEATASMKQLSDTVRQNADSAVHCKQMAMSASTTTLGAGEVVAKVIATMKGIDESSRKIADIISVIDGIAFQTNILALNAAVEAARAGEQGRGFAVVASEVRSLAGRSAVAASEIRKLIHASVVQVEQGSVLVNRAGVAMAEVVNAIQHVNVIMGEISTASTEQSQGVTFVGQAVAQLDQVTQQNSALVEEMAASASGLKTQAQDLVGAVAVFKLPIGKLGVMEVHMQELSSLHAQQNQSISEISGT